MTNVQIPMTNERTALPFGKAGGLFLRSSMAGRKRRTEEHVLEELSLNYLHHRVSVAGYVLERPRWDYGTDAIMFHFNEQGEVENGQVFFQLKATNDLPLLHKNTIISCQIEVSHLKQWIYAAHPFILVVYDARFQEAWWLHIQEYVLEHPEIDWEQTYLNVHIPVTNSLTVRAVQNFRRLSLDEMRTSSFRRPPHDNE